MRRPLRLALRISQIPWFKWAKYSCPSLCRLHRLQSDCCKGVQLIALKTSISLITFHLRKDNHNDSMQYINCVSITLLHLIVNHLCLLSTFILNENVYFSNLEKFKWLESLTFFTATCSYLLIFCCPGVVYTKQETGRSFRECEWEGYIGCAYHSTSKEDQRWTQCLAKRFWNRFSRTATC